MGPYFNSAERRELNGIDIQMKAKNYTTYMPFRDSINLTRAINFYKKQGNTDQKAVALASDAMFKFDVHNLLKSDVVVVVLNGIEPDASTVSIMALAFSACIPVMIYKDDTRWHSMLLELSPYVKTMGRPTIVRKIVDIPKMADKLLLLKTCPCPSDALKEIARAGGRITPGQFTV